MERLSRYSPEVLGILRIVTGLCFLLHGAVKLFNWPPGGQGYVGFQVSQMGVGGILELFGGLLIVLGLLTRPVAFVLSGMMAVAYWQFHAPQGLYPVNNGGDGAILYCFIFLYLVFAGPGAFSLDALRAKRA